MTYSFIKPKKKIFLTPFIKIWITLFCFGALLVFAIDLVYLARIALTNNSAHNKQQEIIVLKEQIAQNEKLFSVLLEQTRIAKHLDTQNQTLRTSLQNLFEMVLKTDGIKLDKFEWKDNILMLSGISPTKEMFALLIETPLKSIFDNTRTSYYKLDNGWYRFISINEQHLVGDER